MSTPVIDLIHHWAKLSKAPSLLEPVYIRDELKIELLFDSSSSIESYKDINASDVVGRVRSDNQKKNISWRDLALTIHGNKNDIPGSEIQNVPWGFDFFRYFNRSLKNKKFPSHNSSGELEFSAYGKAIFCRLGNHRVVAGKVWLSCRPNRFNNSSYHSFREAFVKEYKLNDSLKEIITSAIKNKATIALGIKYLRKLSINDEFIVRINNSVKFSYLLCNSDLEAIKVSPINSVLLKFDFYMRDKYIFKIEWADEIPTQILSLLIE